MTQQKRSEGVKTLQGWKRLDPKAFRERSAFDSRGTPVQGSTVRQSRFGDGEMNRTIRVSNGLFKVLLVLAFRDAIII